jgi:WD40 repeat protein
MFAIFILATLMTPGCSLAGQPTTAVPTSMVSPTPEASATPAPTAIPTLSAEEKIAAAMEVACGERPAISPEVGSSSAETVGARICPDPYYKATIPDEMIAQTPGELQYAIHIYRGQDASGGTCGPYTRTGETEPGGGVYVLTNRPVVVVDIINVKSGEVVDHNSIEGIPASCPQQIPEDTRILSGEEVSGQTIQDALVAALSGFVSSGSGGTVQQVPAPSSLAGSFATFSPDGKVLAVVADANQVVQLWDTTRWKQMRVLRDFEQTIWDVSFSHDGKQVAVDSRAITIWDVASGKQVNALEAHFPIAFSPDGKTLASGSFEGPIQLWDISSGSILHTLEGTISNYGSGSIAFSPDGKLLAVSGGDRQTALVWDVADGKLLATLKGHTRNVSMVIFSQDGKKLATGGLDGAVIVWDTAKWGKLRALAAHTDFVEGIAFSPDGTWIVTAGRDKKIIFWDIASGKKLQILKDFGEGKNIEHIVLSPNGKLLGIVFRDSIDLVQVELP